MPFKIYEENFTLSRDEFILLLLLNGTVNVVTQKGLEISLNGIDKHIKLGLPGVEDGANHFFSTHVGLNGQYKKEFDVSVQSRDGGVTYDGAIKFKRHIRESDLEHES